MFGSSIPSIPLTAPINGMGGGYGSDNYWWGLIILFALFGGNWNGRNNNFGADSPTVVYMDRGMSGGVGSEVQRGFDTSGIIAKLDGINSGICSLGYASYGLRRVLY
jgi:hypothetical protein